MIAYNVYTVVVSQKKIINSKEDITGLLKLLFRVAEMFLVWFEYTYIESCVSEAWPRQWIFFKLIMALKAKLK